MNKKCPLCLHNTPIPYSKGENRTYLQCKTCNLIYVPKNHLPSLECEKTKYDQHQNSPNDNGYRKFLARLKAPLKKFLKPKAKGLDFGSGPGPTLSKMFEEDGFKMDIYDIFYAKDERVFSKKYDFITSTEVIEHMHTPNFELIRLWDMLNKGGLLGIMTGFAPPTKQEFDKWYYKRDLTHVRFFTSQTFKHIALMLKAKIVYLEDGVVIFLKE